METAKFPTDSRLNINTWDRIIILTFTAFSLMLFWGRIAQQYPMIILTGDAGNIASFSAALNDPTQFRGDALLSNPANFGFYTTVHIPIVRGLEWITHDYGLAFTILLPFQPLLQMTGFYLLGRVLYHSRFWALLLALFTLPLVDLNLSEIWGIFYDVLPRVAFQSLLPFVLAVAVLWREKPHRWIWLMLSLGLLVYVHPVSAPSWTLTLWLSLWITWPRYWAWRYRVIYMVVLGLIFIFVSLPFIVNYLMSYTYGQAENYSEVITVMANVYGPGYLDIFVGFRDFFYIMITNGLLPLAFIAIPITFATNESKDDRQNQLIVVTWILGIIFTALIIPIAEHALAQANQAIPLQIDLIRGIRYLIPLAMIFILWALASIHRYFTKRWAKLNSRIVAHLSWVLGIFLVAIWMFFHPHPLDVALYPFQCLSQRTLFCPVITPEMEMIEAIRVLTPEAEAKLLIEEGDSIELAVRYIALRSLVFAYKDQGSLGYANHEELLRWSQIRSELESIRSEQDRDFRFTRFIDLARSLGATHLVVRSTPASLSDDVELLFSNSYGSLLLIYSLP